MFKVGDKVWCLVRGEVEVARINKNYDPPVVEAYVLLTGETEYYTHDGRIFETGERVLYFEEIKIPKSALERPRWRALHGEKYFYVRPTGEVGMRVYRLEFEENIEDKLFEVGNYFQSEEEAKASKFYKVFHNKES